MTELYIPNDVINEIISRTVYLFSYDIRMTYRDYPYRSSGPPNDMMLRFEMNDISASYGFFILPDSVKDAIDILKNIVSGIETGACLDTKKKYGIPISFTLMSDRIVIRFAQGATTINLNNKDTKLKVVSMLEELVVFITGSRAERWGWGKDKKGKAIMNQ